MVHHGSLGLTRVYQDSPRIIQTDQIFRWAHLVNWKNWILQGFKGFLFIELLRNNWALATMSRDIINKLFIWDSLGSIIIIKGHRSSRLIGITIAHKSSLKIFLAIQDSLGLPPGIHIGPHKRSKELMQVQKTISGPILGSSNLQMSIGSYYGSWDFIERTKALGPFVNLWEVWVLS